MTTQKTSNNTIKTILLSAISGIILGLVVGSGFTYKRMALDHFMVHKTNIGFMIFIKDKIYNLSEMRSLE